MNDSASKLFYSSPRKIPQLSNLSRIKAAESSIRDVDIAQETAIMTSNLVMMSAAAEVLTQYNKISKNILSLLQG